MENDDSSLNALSKSIQTNKVDVAKRQLRTAIQMFFDDGDAVSQHTLVYAAHAVLRDICRIRALTFPDSDPRDNSVEHSLRQSLMAPKGFAKRIESAIEEAGTFFKHADEDPDSVLRFAPQTTHLLIYDTLRLLALLDDEFPAETRVYLLWFHLCYPEYIRHKPEVAAELAMARNGASDPTAFKAKCRDILMLEQNTDGGSIVKEEHPYAGVQHVVYVSTNISSGCQHCHQQIDGEEFAESVNHYIQQHGYRLLHVGSQTDRGDRDELWHFTVAVLGK